MSGLEKRLGELSDLLNMEL